MAKPGASITTQVATGLNLSDDAKTWSVTAREIGLTLLTDRQLGALTNTVAPSGNTDLASILTDYVAPAAPGIQQNITIWCTGACKDNDKVKTYQIRASRISTVAPFDKGSDFELHLDTDDTKSEASGEKN